MQAPSNEPVHGHVDEAYWANQGNDAEDGAAQGNYDADFFQDDGLPMPGGPIDDDDDFADAREHFSPAPEAPNATQALDGAMPGSQADAYGAQLVTQSRRFRPEYVQYARVAKKVDVKRLKDELWKGIGFEGVSACGHHGLLLPVEERYLLQACRFPLLLYLMLPMTQQTRQ